MKIEELKKPIWLIHDNLKSKEKIDDLIYLKCASKLSIKQKSLVNCYLIDKTNLIYKINDVLDEGNFNPWWKFEFFNPQRRIKINLIKVEDVKLIKKIESLIQ